MLGLSGEEVIIIATERMACVFEVVVDLLDVDAFLDFFLKAAVIIDARSGRLSSSIAITCATSSCSSSAGWPDTS